MKTGYRGTFVISWSQTEVDGLMGAPVGAIGVGTSWRWTGDPVRVDSPRDVYVLENPIDMDDLHRRAARNVRHLVGTAHIGHDQEHELDEDQALFQHGFDLTDGRERYRATLIKVENRHRPMLMFIGKLPPKNEDLWVVECTIDILQFEQPTAANTATVCFVPGTKITTPDGPKPVQDLTEGDRICTKDNGPQEIRWIGTRRMSGARLFAMPALRPVRIRANVLGQGEPDEDLIVSPDHRILVQGEMARALFNVPEVLVCARDLVNDSSVTVDYSMREVMYYHLMLDQHQVVWANEVECDSFHPASTTLDRLEKQQLDGLLERFPFVQEDPHGYGEYARRSLSASEAAILSYESVGRH